MNYIQHLIGYFKYRLTAGNAHSVHSPFVYELYLNVIGSDKLLDREGKRKLEKYRTKLLTDPTTIEVIDLGAGSKKGKEKLRKVKDIASVSLKSSKEAALLHKLTRYIKAKNVLELGTSLGVSAMYLALANPNSKVISIEGSPGIADMAQNGFDEMGIKNIEVKVGSFNKHLEASLKDLKSIDLIFIDGNHRKEPTLEYLDTSIKYAHDETAFVFDDIRWSKDMLSAWKEIVADPRLHVTIDLFSLGIAFKREKQEKEHFILRV